MNNNLPVLLIAGSSALLKVTGVKAKKLGVDVAFCSESAEDIVKTTKKIKPGAILIDVQPSFTNDQYDTAAGLAEKLCQLFPYATVIAAVYTNIRSIITKFPAVRNLRLAVMPISSGRLAMIAADHTKRNRGIGIQPDIADYLRVKGFDAKLRGFTPVCTAVEMCVREPWRLHDIMNAVYDDAGRRCGSDGRTAERLIRFMSSDVCKRGFSAAISRGEQTGRLTNNELICALCDSFIAYMKAFGAGDDAIRMLP